MSQLPCITAGFAFSCVVVALGFFEWLTTPSVTTYQEEMDSCRKMATTEERVASYTMITGLLFSESTSGRFVSGPVPKSKRLFRSGCR